jgi:hypothetical protein
MQDLETMFLTPDEIIQATGYKQRRCQERWCFENGVTFMRRCNGSLLISRRHFEHLMGGMIDAIGATYQEPDYSSVQ